MQMYMYMVEDKQLNSAGWVIGVRIGIPHNTYKPGFEHQNRRTRITQGTCTQNLDDEADGISEGDSVSREKKVV